MKIEYYTVILTYYDGGYGRSNRDIINFTTKEEAKRYINIHKQELFTSCCGGYAGSYAHVIKRALHIEEKAE